MNEATREEQAKQFWAAVQQARGVVESWPKWKQEAAAASTRVSPRNETRDGPNVPAYDHTARS